MHDEAPIPFQHRFVADADTSNAMGRAYLAHFNRQRPAWLLYLCVWLLVTLMLYVSFDDDRGYSVATKVFGGVVYGFLPALVFAFLINTLIYVRTVRNGRTRVFDGAVLESGFGDDAIVIRNPVASGRTSYAAVQSVSVEKTFVFVRFEGNPVTNAYPRALFPDDGLARLQAAGVRVTRRR